MSARIVLGLFSKWFNIVVLQVTAQNCSKVRAARAARLFFHSRPDKLLIYGAFVAGHVVHAKARY